ncbi:cupin domain-containing protein [Dyella japonica]|uniref:Cupin n=1 Tax=Dyella japonica A8 TaxID=1217721 RepID=A0A075K1U9_9GAMM|nr:cupin domain-containing protein [Dyella japonica]AIF48179.1 cupin [Dyella japonica A8]
MRMFKTFGLMSLAACSATVPLLALAQSASTPAHAQVAELMTKALGDYPGKEGKMILVTYPPGSVDPVHRHDANAFVYVIEGSIVMSLKGGKEVTLGPGQTFYEGPNDIHTVGRNASLTQPAKFVVFLLKDQNKPVLTLVH